MYFSTSERDPRRENDFSCNFFLSICYFGTCLPLLACMACSLARFAESEERKNKTFLLSTSFDFFLSYILLILKTWEAAGGQYMKRRIPNLTREKSETKNLENTFPIILQFRNVMVIL